MTGGGFYQQQQQQQQPPHQEEMEMQSWPTGPKSGPSASASQSPVSRPPSSPVSLFVFLGLNLALGIGAAGILGIDGGYIGAGAIGVFAIVPAALGIAGTVMKKRPLLSTYSVLAGVSIIVSLLFVLSVLDIYVPASSSRETMDELADIVQCARRECDLDNVLGDEEHIILNIVFQIHFLIAVANFHAAPTQDPNAGGNNGGGDTAQPATTDGQQTTTDTPADTPARRDMRLMRRQVGSATSGSSQSSSKSSATSSATSTATSGGSGAAASDSLATPYQLTILPPLLGVHALFMALGIVGAFYFRFDGSPGKNRLYDTESMKNLNSPSLSRDVKYGTGMSSDARDVKVAPESTYGLPTGAPVPFSSTHPANSPGQPNQQDLKFAGGPYGQNANPNPYDDESPDWGGQGKNNNGFANPNQYNNNYDAANNSYGRGVDAKNSYGNGELDSNNFDDGSSNFYGNTAANGMAPKRTPTTAGGYSAPSLPQKGVERPYRSRDTLYTQGGFGDEEEEEESMASPTEKPQQQPPMPQQSAYGARPGPTPPQPAMVAGNGAPRGAPGPSAAAAPVAGPAAAAAAAPRRVRRRTRRHQEGAKGVPGGAGQTQQQQQPLQQQQQQQQQHRGGADATPAPGQKHKVVKRHKAQLEDEVGLEVGDVVEIEEVFEDGWGTGTNVSTGEFGAFPLSCLGSTASQKQRVQSMYFSNRDTMYSYRS
ncbi:hypothetical protein DFJ73DRAFT_957307 [Zopfochytrium polystomum]|nr:hypothetical protein DFJ73DRAFT_957307 [Zopfochytrium polystomum]